MRSNYLMIAIAGNLLKIRSNLATRVNIMTTTPKIIKLAGGLDDAKATELCDQVSELLAAGNNFVMLDMANVDFINSSGLGALILILKMLRTAGGDLYLCSIAEPVKNLLKITKMDRLFGQPISKSSPLLLRHKSASGSSKPRDQLFGAKKLLK
jgi:anti-anti-sigma factor